MGVGASEPSRRLRIPSHIRARPRAPAASLPPFPVQTATGQEEPRQGGDQLRGDQRGRPAQRGPAVDDQVVDRRENHEVIQQSKWRGPAGQPVWEAAIPPALPPAAAPWQTPVVRWQCAPGSGTGSAVSPGRGRPAAEAGQQRSVPPRQVSGASWLLPGQPAVALPPRRPVRLGPRSARLWGAGAMEPQRSWGPGFWACSPSVPSFLGAGGPARSPASSGRDGEPLCT